VVILSTQSVSSRAECLGVLIQLRVLTPQCIATCTLFQ
jgi:hypothetical protein